MSVFADIDAILSQVWITYGLGYPTACETGDFRTGASVFVPPNNAAWCSLSTMPVSPIAPAAIGASAPLEHVLLYQIDINHPLDAGKSAIYSDAGTVAAIFNPGTTFSNNNMRLHVDSCDRSGIRRDDSWLTISLTAKLRGWQTRA